MGEDKTAPANRAPRFVVMDPTGGAEAICSDEAGARAYAARHHARGLFTIHPIGAALPAKVAVTSPGRVLYERLHGPGRDYGSTTWPEIYESTAQAVIAAHEAGKPKVEYETVTRWAVFDSDDETWWDGDEWTTDKSKRALYARYSGAAGQCSGNARAVRITTRRRVRK